MDIEKNKRAQWIDIQKPTGKDLSWLKEKFKLHPVIVDELRSPSARAHVEQYDDYLYFIYYFPVYDAEDAASARTEIDFIVTKSAVVTIHYEPLTGVLEDFDIGTLDSSLKLVYGLIQHLINFEERQLRHIREKVENIGREIFRDKEREILEKITHLKRDISEYRIVVRLQGPILNSLLSIGKKFWDSDSEIYLNDLVGDQLKVVNQIEDYRDAVRDFEATNNQLMNLKVNSVMKTFTSLSFLTFPFMLFAALFSMRTVDTPLINTPGGFWIILGVMLIGMLALGIYFSNKKWF
jgi:magnesium transporter